MTRLKRTFSGEAVPNDWYSLFLFRHQTAAPAISRILRILCLLALLSRQPAQAQDSTDHNRVWILGTASAAVYTGSLFILNEYWYKDYPKKSFHTLNDFGEWLQVDKFGHTYSAYMLAKYSRELWRWTGIPRKQQIWIGGLSGFAYQSVIELLDAHSGHWGFSWSDMGANATGAAAMISQELLWDEQRILLKFSTIPKRYTDPILRSRTDEQFGDILLERILKDYNAQTYWLSVNPSAFVKDSRFPKWLNIAIGYGADGMYAADDNTWEDAEGRRYNYAHIHRTRQFYLSPDIDFTRIPTRKKGLKILFQVLNSLKFPAPTLEVNSAGRIRMHAVFF